MAKLGTCSRKCKGRKKTAFRKCQKACMGKKGKRKGKR